MRHGFSRRQGSEPTPLFNTTIHRMLSLNILTKKKLQPKWPAESSSKCQRMRFHHRKGTGKVIKSSCQAIRLSILSANHQLRSKLKEDLQQQQQLLLSKWQKGARSKSLRSVTRTRNLIEETLKKRCKKQRQQFNLVKLTLSRSPQKRIISSQLSHQWILLSIMAQ